MRALNWRFLIVRPSGSSCANLTGTVTPKWLSKNINHRQFPCQYFYNLSLLTACYQHRLLLSFPVAMDLSWRSGVANISMVLVVSHSGGRWVVCVWNCSACLIRWWILCWWCLQDRHDVYTIHHQHNSITELFPFSFLLVSLVCSHLF